MLEIEFLADEAVWFLTDFKDLILAQPLVLLTLGFGNPALFFFEQNPEHGRANESEAESLTDLQLCWLDASTAFELYYESLCTLADLGYFELLIFGPHSASNKTGWAEELGEACAAAFTLKGLYVPPFVDITEADLLLEGVLAEIACLASLGSDALFSKDLTLLNFDESALSKA